MHTDFQRGVAALVAAIVVLVIAVFAWIISANQEAEAYAISDEDMLSLAVSDVLLTAEEQAAIQAEAKALAEAAAAEAVATEEVAMAEQFADEYSEDWSDYGYFEEDEVGEVWFIPYDGSGYYNANVSENWHAGSNFVSDGIYRDNSGFSFTYYSENVRPGGGLDIPGRHVGDEGYVVDGDGNVCIASDDLPYGTVVDIPFGGGTGVVYDSGSGNGNLDVYVSW